GPASSGSARTSGGPAGTSSTIDSTRMLPRSETSGKENSGTDTPTVGARQCKRPAGAHDRRRRTADGNTPESEDSCGAKPGAARVGVTGAVWATTSGNWPTPPGENCDGLFSAGRVGSLQESIRESPVNRPK